MIGKCGGKIGNAAIVDLGVPEAYGQVLRAPTGRDHRPPRQPLVVDIPEPRHIATVGRRGVDREYHGLGLRERQRLGPASRILGQQQAGRRRSRIVAVAKRPAGEVTVRIPLSAARGSTPISSAAASAQAALLTLKTPGTLSWGSQTCCVRSTMVPLSTR